MVLYVVINSQKNEDEKDHLFVRNAVCVLF